MGKLELSAHMAGKSEIPVCKEDKLVRQVCREVKQQLQVEHQLEVGRYVVQLVQSVCTEEVVLLVLQ